MENRISNLLKEIKFFILIQRNLKKEKKFNKIRNNHEMQTTK